MSKDFSNQIAVQYSKNLPFVVYRKPKEELVQAQFQKDDTLHHLADFSETGFVFAPFDTREKIVLLRCDEFLEAVVTYEGRVQSEDFVFEDDEEQREFHIDLVDKGIGRIRKNDFQKVVLSRRIEVECKTTPLVLFERLLENYPNAFCYLWHHPKVGTWLGATPEILLKTENQQITTMSLAGTQRFEGNANPAWGAKELEEQQMVTDYISNALKEKVVKLTISERETVRAGNLLHLRTKLMAIYLTETLGEIVNALHPTPAICGIPMKPSKDFVLKNENYQREFYTGYLGELHRKREIGRSTRKKNTENTAYKAIKTTTTLFVNLRCMQLKEGKAYIYVGGGVTKDSDAQNEWQETVAKAITMLKVLNA